VFTIQFKVQNRSDSPIRPELVSSLGGKTGVLVVGNCAEQAVEEVGPGSLSTPIGLSFLPVRSGIQQLPRLVVHDLLTNSQFEWNIPFPIFVERRDFDGSAGHSQKPGLPVVDESEVTKETTDSSPTGIQENIKEEVRQDPLMELSSIPAGVENIDLTDHVDATEKNLNDEPAIQTEVIEADIVENSTDTKTEDITSPTDD